MSLIKAKLNARRVESGDTNETFLLVGKPRRKKKHIFRGRSNPSCGKYFIHALLSYQLIKGPSEKRYLLVWKHERNSRQIPIYT